MAHELDQTNGVTSFAAREDAWHRLGTTVGEAMTAQQALELAHLARWNVRKVPLFVETPKLDETGVSTVFAEIDNKFATVRTNPVTGETDCLGVVGNQYTPVQNEAHTDLLNALVDESGAHFETAGALRGGREVFVTMQFPDHMKIGGVDPISLNIAALNSHDGSSAFRFIVTPIRIVCANTQAAALRGARSSFSARHTRNIGSTITAAREALGMTFDYATEFQREAEQMIQTTMTNREFDKLVENLFPEGAEKNSPQFQRKSADLAELFRSADTNKLIRNTRWCAYQAVTEYVDHYAPAEGGADGRAARALGATAQGLKNRAFGLASVSA